jgi:hypothetical protein
MPSDQPHESGTRSELLSQTQGNPSPTQDKLNNYRNSFAFVANLLVLALGLAVFALMEDR